MKAKQFFSIISMLKSTDDELTIDAIDGIVWIEVESDVRYLIKIRDEFNVENGSYKLLYSMLLKLLRNCSSDMNIQLNGNDSSFVIKIGNENKSSFFNCPFVYSVGVVNHDIIEQNSFAVNTSDFKQSCKALCNSSEEYIFSIFKNGITFSPVQATLHQLIQLGDAEEEGFEKTISNTIIQRLSRIASINSKLYICIDGIYLLNDNVSIYIQF